MHLMCIGPVARDVRRARTDLVDAFLPAGLCNRVLRAQLQQWPFLELAIEEAIDLFALLTAVLRRAENLFARAELLGPVAHFLRGIEALGGELRPCREILEHRRRRR